MKINIIESLPKEQEANRSLPISFSRYYRLSKCLLYGIYPTHTYENRKDDLTSFLLGKIHHLLCSKSECIRRLSQGDLMDYIFNVVDSEIANVMEIANDSSLPDKIRYHDKLNKIVDSAFLLHNTNVEYHKTEHEVKLVSSDGNSFGIIDELQFLNNKITLIDHKISDLQYLGAEKNIQQIIFYAHLVYDNYRQLPKSCIIKGLMGDHFEVHVDKSAILEIKNNISLISELLKRPADDLSIATAPSQCNKCPRAPYCAQTKASSFDSINGFSKFISGDLIGIVDEHYVIETKYGFYGQRKKIKIPVLDISLNIGQSYTFTDLIFSSDDKVTLTEESIVGVFQ